ncbi:MAG: S8 family peptidase [Abditibacteriales bacterium]|nr:S8 family peptidase [Abditibacteriales bacterium]MDW8364386.1 S8 family peptidase [Abditibacteriales bacterium]
MKSASSPTLRWLSVVILALTALPIVFSLTFQKPSARPEPTVTPSDTDPREELLVDLKDNTTPQEITALEQKYNIDLEFNTENAHDEKLMVADIDPARLSDLVTQLRREPTVEIAEPNVVYHLPPDEEFIRASRGTGEVLPPDSHAAWAPNDPRYKEQWNFRMIGMEQAWEKTRGKGVVVAVIDTGVAFENDHKCYWAKDFRETKFVRGYDFVNKDEHPHDDHGHGTHVAGTIAESTNNNEGVAGIAFEATIMPLKVLSASGGGSAADIADAIRFAADHGANVINMSLGGPFPSGAMESACKYAASKGVVIVCAAGNSGREGVSYPAAFKECIAVSAVGPKGELTRYSSYGKEIAIAAPGGDTALGREWGILQNTVYQGVDDYYYFNGTSMASPHVAGVAALIMSLGVKDPAQVKAVLQKSAKPKEPKKKYGAGLLNAADAVKLATSAEFQQPLLADTDEASGATTDGPKTILTVQSPIPIFNKWIDLLVKVGMALLISGVCFAVGKFKKRTKGTAQYPLAVTAMLLAGLLLPDLVMWYWGANAWVNLLAHSVVIPSLLLALGLQNKRALQLLAYFTAAVTLHLAWDVWRHVAPFADLGVRALPWLMANIIVGVGVVIAAIRRCTARLL